MKPKAARLIAANKKGEDVMEPQHIGDGLYASHDGWHVWLTTPQGMRVALEPNVFRAMTDWVRAVERDAGNPGFWTGDNDSED